MNYTNQGYINTKYQLCGGGMVNITGTNLTGIMKTMKFAFHSQTSQDIEELREKISNENFPYTLTTDNKIPKNSFFKGGVEFHVFPKPVITTRGLCFAANAKDMNEVFAKSKYIDNFQEVFGTDEQIQLLNGHQSIRLEINMHSKYLTDRNETSGNFW